ncbi:hypothetical protein GCM10010862_21400 [Devosia nitrariae]|uniref:Uncharacterized protein n=1 Tax=Devosia nitrariae TaxID=2071872 RepID=A0ABQ5W509_9HYPH|nr:hypothetical protein GCM10010862_21400 [Devosia nitrariae]
MIVVSSRPLAAAGSCPIRLAAVESHRQIDTAISVFNASAAPHSVTKPAPDGKYVELSGRSHLVSAEAVAPELIEFFLAD